MTHQLKASRSRGRANGLCKLMVLGLNVSFKVKWGFEVMCKIGKEEQKRMESTISNYRGRW